MEKTIEQAIREVTGATDAEQFAQMNETAYKVAVKVYEACLEQKESEDERIRKDIIAFLQSMNSHCNPTQDWDLRNRWLPYLERREEQQEIPLMDGDTDLYFDEWKQRFQGNPTKRQCFEEGIRYSERKQKKELIPLINRLCEAILFEWKDAADLARKTLTQIKAREE